MFKKIFAVFALSLALVACDSGSSDNKGGGAGGGKDNEQQEQDR